MQLFVSSYPKLDSPIKAKCKKRDVGSMDIESRALFDRTKNRG
jgi:pyrroloquinoline quinone (PQQ) biosynthesis protein C